LPDKIIVIIIEVIHVDVWNRDIEEFTVVKILSKISILEVLIILMKLTRKSSFIAIGSCGSLNFFFLMLNWYVGRNRRGHPWGHIGMILNCLYSDHELSILKIIRSLNLRKETLLIADQRVLWSFGIVLLKGHFELNIGIQHAECLCIGP